MLKKLIYLLIPLCIHADSIPETTRQLILVDAKDLNARSGVLSAHEKRAGRWEMVFGPMEVNLGRNGLAWSKAQSGLPIKHEGDGKAPAGLFSLHQSFGYEAHRFKLPYRQLSPLDVCVDDSSSKDYNQLLRTSNPQKYKSYEQMLRKDNLYKLGIVVDYNTPAVDQRGSCIFIHIQRAIKSPTAGCTSLSEEQLMLLMQWLDASKNPKLLQGPVDYTQRLFPH